MKNQVFLVFDSLRWDTFKKARVPFLKSLGTWKKAYTQGTYTFPAHMAFFVGNLPQTMDDSLYYDPVATRIDREGKRHRNEAFWRLSNPEAKRPARHTLEGANIVEGFRKHGYRTIGTGAVNWFNPRLPAGRYLTEPFDEFRFFEGEKHASHESAEDQIDWALSVARASTQPYFLFMNFGETHHRFVYRNCPWHDEGDPYGNRPECKRRQIACLEYLDTQVSALLDNLSDFDLVACSDHGEAMGENGLWGHGFAHKTVLTVPLLIRTV